MAAHLAAEAFPFDVLKGDSVDVAPQLLGAILLSEVDGERVALRITEVEAYRGEGIDPGSHAFRGRNKTNVTMFEGAGVLYVYRSYGVHWCGNIVTGSRGAAGGVLLRAGEVVEGLEVARQRRNATGVARTDRDLARGPGRLGSALAFRPELDGSAITGEGTVSLLAGDSPELAKVGTSTRTGVSGEGGLLPYRFFIRDDPYVSAHRPVRT